MRIKYLLCSLFFFLGLSAEAPAANLRISGLRCLKTDGNKVAVGFKISWDNSWRNIYNYDAVYLFGKYKAAGSEEWLPVKWSASGQEVIGGTYTLSRGENGFFVYRASNGSGHAEAELRLVWESPSPAVAAMFADSRAHLEIEGMEMVYIPGGPFFAGDSRGEKSFRMPDFGIIPLRCDLIGNNSTFGYSASSGTANAVTGHVNNSGSLWVASVPAWWQVDFKTPKRILYFGVSSPAAIRAVPGSEWYLLGSNDLSVFDTVWKGGPEYWTRSVTSYPVQQAIRLTAPGNYRYYRIYVPDADESRRPWGNDIRLSNVAMTEEELASEGSSGILVDIPEQERLGNYPTGYNNFYVMKYELTQEQYVAFLNKLGRSGQYSRTVGGLLDALDEGEYVFGEKRREPSYRNGIVLREKGDGSGRPFVFGCSQQPGGPANQAGDGQSVACNYLSPGDLLAYADWAGLRPLSELEYEKLCSAPAFCRWEEGSFAWGDTVMAYGNGLQHAGEETERLREGRTDAGGQAGGPVRVGSFVTEGRTRLASGISFWGVEDLSGNVAGIYYNAGAYGRGLNGGVHGDGLLSGFGESTVAASAWPAEPGAFGLRGGSFEDDAGALRIAARREAEGYFRDLSDRSRKAGFRLGYSLPCGNLEVKLVLENGRTAVGSTLAYDTLCSDAGYRIRAEVAGEGEYVFSWYESRDGGAGWRLLEGRCRSEIVLDGLASGVEWGTASRYLYKCYVSAPAGCGSASCGLVIGRGHTLSRLKDTYQPCMASAGFTVTAPLPARFSWRCLDNGKSLSPASGTAVSSRYEPATNDFRTGDGLPGGKYTVSLEVVLAGRCRTEERLEVDILPYTQNPFPAGDEVFSYGGDSRNLVRVWGGRDRQQWKITNVVRGTLGVGTANGTLTGLSRTLCTNVEVEVRCADFPDAAYRKKVWETTRNFGYTGGVQQILLLPGNYQMNCWGAGGGSGYRDWNQASVVQHASGGKGGYATGKIVLVESQTFYVYVGGAGGSDCHNGGAGGWNGGGHGGTDNNGKGDDSGGGGGGATDIRVGGDVSTRIIVAGGGGGGSDYYGHGGAGGGLSGGYGLISNTGNNYVSPGTQSGGYTSGVGGKGGDSKDSGTSLISGGGGGGGYRGGYGGYSGARNQGSGGGGGSGYVAGTAGCIRSGWFNFVSGSLSAGAGASGNGSASITVYKISD